MYFLSKPQSLEQCKEKNFKRVFFFFLVGFSRLVSSFFCLLGPWFLPTGTAWTHLAQAQQEQLKQLDLEGCSGIMLGAGKPSSIPQAGRKKWWKKKALHLPQKPWCEQQLAIPGSESKLKLSNHTLFFFPGGAKSCSCQAIYLLSD